MNPSEKKHNKSRVDQRRTPSRRDKFVLDTSQLSAEESPSPKSTVRNSTRNISRNMNESSPPRSSVRNRQSSVTRHTAEFSSQRSNQLLEPCQLPDEFLTSGLTTRPSSRRFLEESTYSDHDDNLQRGNEF